MREDKDICIVGFLLSIRYEIFVRLQYYYIGI